MYKNPKKFFVRCIFLTILTIMNVVLLVIFSSGGTTGLIIALILTVINLVLLLYMLAFSIISLIRYLGDSERNALGLHILNFLFVLVLTTLFGVFYFAIIAGALIVLLPFA